MGLSCGRHLAMQCAKGGPVRLEGFTEGGPQVREGRRTTGNGGFGIKKSVNKKGEVYRKINIASPHFFMPCDSDDLPLTLHQPHRQPTHPPTLSLPHAAIAHPLGAYATLRVHSSAPTKRLS